MNPAFFIPRRSIVAATLAASLAFVPPAARAAADLSQASAASGLAVAVSVTTPPMLLSAGSALAVVAVQSAADGAVCVLERASDGARASLEFSGRAAENLSMAVGTAVVVTALSTGWLLSTAVDGASRAIAFVPNEAGAMLLHSERISR